MAEERLSERLDAMHRRLKYASNKAAMDFWEMTEQARELEGAEIDPYECERLQKLDAAVWELDRFVGSLVEGGIDAAEGKKRADEEANALCELPDDLVENILELVTMMEAAVAVARRYAEESCK